MMTFETVSVPSQMKDMRRFPMKGGLLLFDRDSGLNTLIETEETKDFRLRAPRVVQFGITNFCNLACHFCSRDLEASSGWTSNTAFELLSDLARLGVLEVAFGGGEPLMFPKFINLMERLHSETSLASSFTTNGLLLTKPRLQRLQGKYGQIRLSLYENNNWRKTIELMVDQGARFGINYLITPERLDQLETSILELVHAGCRDILLLSYNGRDAKMHLSQSESKRLSTIVGHLSRGIYRQCELKLDVCWGERMERVPRLFQKKDCGAGREFITITSDRKFSPCSFHDVHIGFTDANHLMDLWNHRRVDLSAPAPDAGCARLSGFGL